jgi:prefoldin subunit 5
MDDIPEHLKPTSIILEIIEQIENLKEDILPLKERDEELRNSIKQINSFNVPNPSDINF